MKGMTSFTEPHGEAEDLLTDDDFSIARTDRLSRVLKGIPTEAFISIALSITTLNRWLPGKALSSYSPKQRDEASRRANVLESNFNFLLEEFTPGHLERVTRLLERIKDAGSDPVEDDPDWRKIDWQTVYAAIVPAPLSHSQILEQSDRLGYTVLILVAVTKWAFSEDTFKDLREITTVIGEYSTLFAEECECAEEGRIRATQRGMLSLQTIN
jgi:hypothetical protein